MRRECQVKNFDGLGPFSYVCRMIHFSEPNTNQSQIETGVEGVEQKEDFSSAYCKSVGDQHYLCVVNPERVRGFPVEINLEEGENDADENVFDDDLDSGTVPTTPPKSDQGSDLEPGSKRPREVADERMAPGQNDPDEQDDLGGEDSDDPNQRNVPELEGNLSAV